MRWGSLYPRALKLAMRLALAGCASWLLRQTALHEFLARERDGIGTLILLIGNIYAVMFAFVIFVIWGQFSEVEAFVMRECNSLNELLRFSGHLNPDAGHAIRRAVEDYARAAPKSEWRALGEERRDPATEKAFDDLAAAVVETVPGEGEAAVHQRLIALIGKCGEHRDERITKSLTRIPPTLVQLVNAMAAALLLLVLLYPFQHWAAGFACLAILWVILFLADTVMMDTDNPFQGICNVSAKPFSDLLQ
jgi:hypothetical protein